jgi:hypothetical protein
VEGLFWFAYSVAIHWAERAELEIRTSSIRPFTKNWTGGLPQGVAPALIQPLDAVELRLLALAAMLFTCAPLTYPTMLPPVVQVRAR